MMNINAVKKVLSSLTVPELGKLTASEVHWVCEVGIRREILLDLERETERAHEFYLN